MKFLLYTFLGLISLGGRAQDLITQYLQYGEYEVGYQVIHKYDYGRSYFPKYDYYGYRTGNPIGRPVQISIWYPAKTAHLSSLMSYQDYIGYTASEIYFEKNSLQDRNSAIDAFIQSIEGEVKQVQLKKLLSGTTHAYLNAEELSVEFPIILYAPPMNTSAIDNSIICEHLASKGYVVLSTMAKGTYTPLQGRSIQAAIVQSEDLAFLLNFAKNRYTSDRIGVIGFSLGGMANIIVASKNKAIDATISLDGSIMSPGWLNDFMKSDLYDPESFASNLLFIGKNLKAPDQNPSTFLDQVKYADKALIRYDMEEHNYFSGLHLLYNMIDQNLTAAQKQTNYRFYAEMTKYIGDFFDQYLKDLNVFKEHPHQSYDLCFHFEKGKRAPLDPNSIGQLIGDRGLEYVNAIIDSTLNYEKQYLKNLDWRILVLTANTLHKNGRLDEAIQTLQLADRVFPNWFEIHQELGNLYLEVNDWISAEKHFRMALADHPKDVQSKEALQQMGKEVPDYHNTRIEDLKPYLGKYVVDEERFRDLYLKNGQLYLESNYWPKPVILWPYRTDLFLVEGDDPRNNMQILFQFNGAGEVASMCTRGMNSGRVNAPNPKVILKN